jgi:2-polyprenyl-3-methyl-5-hydroxy-6-metoxy-1,4-benzoquinol methylase
MFRKYQVLACSNCGYRWLNPPPTDAELSEIYSEEYFLDNGDEKVTEIVNKLKRSTAELYLEQFEKDNKSVGDLSLLEIGCGMGDFLLAAQEKGFKVSGLEVTDHLVEFVNRRLGFSGVQKGYIENVAYQKGSFDVVAFFDVIEHVRNPVEYMKRVNGLLKTSGKVFLATPALDSWSAKLLGNNWMEFKVEHLSYFNKKSITQLLEKTGFYNVRFYSNYKVLNFDYITRHFVRFPVPGLSPILGLVRKIMPSAAANFPFKIVASGMAVIAEKRHDIA